MPDAIYVFEMKRNQTARTPRHIDEKWLVTRQVVVISGVRRCGKSYLQRQIRERCELRRRGKEVFYHGGARECDFIVRTGRAITQCVQVTVTLENEQTRKREVEGLMEAARTYGTTDNVVITLEQEDFVADDENMRVIPSCKHWGGDTLFRII